MLSLHTIAEQFSAPLRAFKYAMLREYLQYKILDIIFSQSSSSKLLFIGGTALRIVHDIPRFSEDLDFDNHNITSDEFEALGDAIHAAFQKENVRTEVDMVGKLAMRLRVKVPELLYTEGISPLPEEKILIQVDTLMQGVDYAPDTVLLERFDILRPIRVAPLDILLAQKLYAILNRKTVQARDLYDAVYLLSRTAPNVPYLKQKIGTDKLAEIYMTILTRLEGVDIPAQGKSLAPFLFDAADVRKIELFPALIKKRITEMSH